MKIIQLISTVFLMTLGMAPANAMSVSFDLAGSPTSSVAVTSFTSGGFFCNFTGCGIDVALDSNLDSQQNSLSVGDSWTIPFFDISFHGAGGGTATIAATLGFDAPTGAPSSGVGSGGFLTFFGAITGGNLNWNTQPGITTLADGTSYSVNFQNLSGITTGNATVNATIKLLSEASSVPEPDALVLVGIGLVGLSFFSRRAKTQTYA